jgi:RNA polymerase sigma factor (sigma-70 family)
MCRDPVVEDNGPLLAAAAKGDQSSWDALIARYNGLLWYITRSFELSVADGADAVQNTWLRLVENLDRIQEPDRLGSWLATTARRECLLMLRRRTRERVNVTADWLVDVPAPAGSADEAILLGERDAALWRALRLLSERCQRLLRVLMASPPPSYAEVAAALDLAVGSIGPARQRCLGQLRSLVSADELLTDRPIAAEDL